MTPCNCTAIYQRERDRLTPQQIDKLLDSGRTWQLSSTLESGGTLIFPHTYLASCGSFIAACVQAALDTGTDHVLALGVLHAANEPLIEARRKERLGEDLVGHPLRGVHGPQHDMGYFWQKEYSLLSFEFLWNEEIKRRGIKPPRLSLRYPYLVNRSPKSLPGVAELEAIAKDACVVATSDFCHHGVAYGTLAEKTLVDDEGLAFARKNIEKHLQLLENGDFAAHYKHCLQIKSDSYDVSPMLYHLLGPLKATVCDSLLIDTSELYEGLAPSWVAASLVKMDSK